MGPRTILAPTLKPLHDFFVSWYSNKPIINNNRICLIFKSVIILIYNKIKNGIKKLRNGLELIQKEIKRKNKI